MFDAGWRDAAEEAADKLELEARRRALGFDQTVHTRQRKSVLKESGAAARGGDAPIGPESSKAETETEATLHVTKYSDALLMVLLKANMPEKFGGKNPTEKSETEEIARDVDPPVVERGRAPE